MVLQVLAEAVEVLRADETGPVLVAIDGKKRMDLSHAASQHIYCPLGRLESRTQLLNKQCKVLTPYCQRWPEMVRSN